MFYASYKVKKSKKKGTNASQLRKFLNPSHFLYTQLVLKLIAILFIHHNVCIDEFWYEKLRLQRKRRREKLSAMVEIIIIICFSLEKHKGRPK